MTLDGAALNDQFVLFRGSRAHPDDWVRRSAGSWVLASSPTLPVTPLLDEHGEVAGWLLGWAVGAGDELLHEQESLPLRTLVPGDDGDVDAAVESGLYRLAGRWACLLVGDSPRAYLDPAGSLALVYSTDGDALASTTTALRFATPAVSGRFVRRTLRSGHYLPAGLTSDPRALRLLPNHYLDLTSWHSVRHWPTAPLDRVGAEGVDRRIATIANSMTRLLGAFARRHELVLPLTAGRDSRMIMAASRTLLARCSFATFEYPDERRADAAYAREVARRLGVQLTVLPLAEVDDEAAEAYLERIGYDANEGKAADFDLAARALPMDRVWVTGFAGEVGRGAYWWQAQDLSEDMSPAEVLRAIRLPDDAEHEKALGDWMAETPHQDVQELLDLAYLELRVGCWASPQLYGAAPFAVSVLAMNQRAVFEAMLELPLEYRRAQHMRTEVIRANWPELVDLPYERAPGRRGWTTSARRTLYAVRVKLALRSRAGRLLGR